MAIQLADMAVRTVAAEDGFAPVGEGPDRAISMLRENLDYLERMFEENRTG